MQLNELKQNEQLLERWKTIAIPGSEHTERAFGKFVQVFGQRNVLNCAIPLTRAKSLTGFQLPEGLSLQDCIIASKTGNFPEALLEWKYQPIIRYDTQLPQMAALPTEHTSLVKVPWFQSPSQATGLGINARHLRYHYQLWHDIRPKVLQGVNTTLILGLPQIGNTLAPHIQTDKLFLFLGSLGRALCPIQLFPANYIFPDAQLGELANYPAPVFADILPLTGGFAFPTVDCEPDPWRVLARYGNGDRYFGYPFRQAKDSVEDFTLSGYESGAMLLPNGTKVTARQSKSHVYATLDPQLKEEMMMERDRFEEGTCLLRGAITHDGLPFYLPVELQPLVLAIVLTHWKMELDKPGDLASYTVTTEHAAIRGFSYFQRIEPFYTNFMRMIQELSRDATFRTYPLSTHLTYPWLGGNLRLANQLSQSEFDLGPELMRSYYHQQLDWQAGILNLMNHVAFRTKCDGAILSAFTGMELEEKLNLDGLAMHQMHRLLRFDSHLFPRPTKRASFWPDHNPAFADLDQKVLTESLPKL